jgi:adenylate cyclase
MPTEKAKRKLAAVLHADVKGYSRLMGEDEEATVRALASSREEMARLVQVHRGRVVDTAGDGFLLEFASVVDAVGFALEFQEEIKGRNADVPENRRMEFRIGINVGDVIAEGDKIYGDGVNIAARLEALAEGGGICISGTAHDQVKKKLALDYEFLGEQTVKNIAEPVRAYRVRMSADVSGGEELTGKSIHPRAWRTTALAALSILTAIAVAAALWHFFVRPGPTPTSVSSAETPALPLPDKPSIAVLPFANMSGDPKQEYFSDGITEEIITGLAKVPKLFVIARNSSFAFKGKPVTVQDVARKLAVRYVLVGSVRKVKDRVRITAQLIDAQTGGHVWAERYDRELKDIFALQDEVTLAVMKAMRVKLIAGEQARQWAKKGTDNLEAYQKFLEAQVYSRQVTKAGTAKARQLLEEAQALDPTFAGARALLAHGHLMDAFMGWSKNPRTSGRKAYELARKAVKLDDSLDPAHYIIGLVYVYLHEFDKAVAEGERAVELNPNGAEALAFLGYILNCAGRPTEAIETLQRAIRLNPMPPAFYYHFLGAGYMQARQYDKAVVTYKKALRLQPEYANCLLGLAAAYSRTGHKEKARETVAKFLTINPKFSLTHLEKVFPYKDPAARKRTIDALRKAGLK